MKIHVLFPGPARDAAGTDRSTLDLPEGSAARDIRAALESSGEPLNSLLCASRLAVNNAFARDEQPLHEGDVVAVIAPVSGG